MANALPSRPGDGVARPLRSSLVAWRLRTYRGAESVPHGRVCHVHGWQVVQDWRTLRCYSGESTSFKRFTAYSSNMIPDCWYKR